MTTTQPVTSPDVGTALERLQRGIKNLSHDPFLISELTKASLPRAFWYYSHPRALTLALRMYRTLRPLHKQRWFVGGLTLMEGLTIYALVRLSFPHIVLETGVANGVSSAYILQALHDNGDGRLISIDLPAHTTQVIDHVLRNQTTGWLVPNEFREMWTLHLGDAKLLLPSLFDELSSIDIFFHDSDHSYEHMLWECSTAWSNLRIGGFLLVHDVNWHSAFLDFAASVGVKPHIQGNRLGILRKS